jgi:hypothetical protein
VLDKVSVPDDVMPSAVLRASWRLYPIDDDYYEEELQ